MKPRSEFAPHDPGKDVLFLAVLIALAVLVFAFWVADQSRRTRDKSRVSWPEPKLQKP